MLKSSNPYHVLSENISFDNVQQIGELITLKALRGFLAFSRQSFEKLYIDYVKDINRLNYPAHTFSDSYDLAQTAICFLCDFIGRALTDVYTIKNGKGITIKQATYALVCRHVNRMRRHTQRSCDIDLYSDTLSVDIDHYKEKDYSNVDNTISRLGLTTVEQETLDCYMGGMSCKEIAEFLDINRVTVWRRRQRLQVKYKLYSLLSIKFLENILNKTSFSRLISVEYFSKKYPYFIYVFVGVIFSFSISFLSNCIVFLSFNQKLFLLY